jgi:hypothetical protein
MGFLTWAKCKLEENWLASLVEAITKVEGFLDVGQGEKYGVKKENKFSNKKAHYEGERNHGQNISKGEKPKQFQGSSFKPKGKLIKKGVFFKGNQPKGDTNGKPEEHVSIATRWDIIPRIARSPNYDMGVPK